MTKTEYYEDYVVGSQRETSGRTITEADLVIHAGHSGDYFPHHVDAEFARTTPFGQRIAHGTMTFTIGIGLTASQINAFISTLDINRVVTGAPDAWFQYGVAGEGIGVVLWAD